MGHERKSSHSGSGEKRKKHTFVAKLKTIKSADEEESPETVALSLGLNSSDTGSVLHIYIYIYIQYIYIPVWGRVRVPPPQPCESQKATERKHGAWGYNWTTLSLGDINTGTWSSRLGVRRKADDLALLRNPKKWNPYQMWQNFLRKAMAQKSAVLPMMV
jgi:hypothetical protein